jgi:hypothetical protein
MPTPDLNFGQFSIEDFIKAVPFWGGYINCHQRQNIELKNTCPIDNLLFGLFVISKIKRNFIESLPLSNLTEHLKTVLKLIETGKWNLVKQYWFVTFMNSNVLIVANQISLWGSENERFSHYLESLQSYKLIQLCSFDCNYNNYTLSEDSYSLFLTKNIANNAVELYSSYIGNCPLCALPIQTCIKFTTIPNFLILESANSRNIITYNDLDKVISIDNKMFRLICATFMVNNDHFIAIFDFQNKNYYVNAIGSRCIEMPPYDAQRLNSRRVPEIEKTYKLQVSSALYYLSD